MRITAASRTRSIWKSTNPASTRFRFPMREDGFEFDKWLMTTDRDFRRPDGVGPESAVHSGAMPKTYPMVPADKTATARPAGNKNTSKAVSDLPLILPRKPDGDGSVGSDGRAETMAQGHVDARRTLRARAGQLTESVHRLRDECAVSSFRRDAVHHSRLFRRRWQRGGNVGRIRDGPGAPILHPTEPAIGRTQSSCADRPSPWNVPVVFKSRLRTKSGRDLRAHGRLQYVRKPYLRFAGSGKYFIKAGADAPETLLGYADFDNTIAGKPKEKVGLKTWQPHVRDWREGDPTWKGGKGKGADRCDQLSIRKRLQRLFILDLQRGRAMVTMFGRSSIATTNCTTTAANWINGA